MILFKKTQNSINKDKMTNVIQLKSKEDFKKCRDEVKHKSTLKWKMYMWDWFRGKTCYYPDEDCFISLSRAKEMGLSIKPFDNELNKIKSDERKTKSDERKLQ